MTVAFAIGSLGVWEKISKMRFSRTPKLPAAKAIENAKVAKRFEPRNTLNTRKRRRRMFSRVEEER